MSKNMKNKEKCQHLRFTTGVRNHPINCWNRNSKKSWFLLSDPEIVWNHNPGWDLIAWGNCIQQTTDEENNSWTLTVKKGILLRMIDTRPTRFADHLALEDLEIMSIMISFGLKEILRFSTVGDITFIKEGIPC